MVIATEALKLEACGGAGACSGVFAWSGLSAQAEMFHLPFSLFCGARAWSHPMSRWQLPALARHGGPTAPRQLRGHSRGRGPAQGANLETVPAKAESESLGLHICQKKKKSQQNEPTSSRQWRMMRTLQMQNIQYPCSSFLKRAWNLGSFTGNQCVLFQRPKESQGEALAAARSRKAQPWTSS